MCLLAGGFSSHELGPKSAKSMVVRPSGDAGASPAAARNDRSPTGVVVKRRLRPYSPKRIDVGGEDHMLRPCRELQPEVTHDLIEGNVVPSRRWADPGVRSGNMVIRRAKDMRELRSEPRHQSCNCHSGDGSRQACSRQASTARSSRHDELPFVRTKTIGKKAKPIILRLSGARPGRLTP